MLQNKAYAAYANNKIMTASPAELTLMLYDGAIKFCNIAIMAVEKEDIQQAPFSQGFVSLCLCKSVPLCSPCIFDCFNYNHLYDSTKRTNKLASCCCLCVLFKLKTLYNPCR